MHERARDLAALVPCVVGHLADNLSSAEANAVAARMSATRAMTRHLHFYSRLAAAGYHGQREATDLARGGEASVIRLELVDDPVVKLRQYPWPADHRPRVKDAHASKQFDAFRDR